MDSIERKIDKLEKEIFSVENVQALETFCENMKVINQVLRKGKKVKGAALPTKTNMADMLGIKLKELKVVPVYEFSTDLERDYLMGNLVNKGLAEVIKNLNRHYFWFNGVSIKSVSWKTSVDSFIKFDDDRLEIKGRSLIRKVGDIKYLMFKGETKSGFLSSTQGSTWVMCRDSDMPEALNDFEEMYMQNQLYKNKFVDVHSEMKLSTSIKCKLSLDEMGLSPEIKTEAEQIIKMFSHSEMLEKNGLAFRRNVLFYGDPGYGKTTVINSIIKEALKCGGTVFSFSLKNSTDSVDKLMQLLSVINSTYPSMLVLEDVDLIAKDRGDYSSLSNTILKMVEDNKKFIVLASTNDVKMLDGAFIRHGRMEKVFHISLSTKDKYKVFGNHLKYYELEFDNWEEDTEVVKFLNKSSTSGAVINSVLMCTKQDLIMSGSKDHKEPIRNSIKSLTWQNGSDEDEGKYII